mmetsp:Transcript_34169/g.81303  ORF Transcript_34169/g.81303 Transcript_34169/m.81303 type:complete len:189 (-) Transcript_34169:71-637(-)
MKVRKQLRRALSGRSSCLPASRSRPTRARPRLGDCTTAPRRTRCGPRCRRPSTTPTTSAAAEAPDAAFAHKKLAELRAKSHSDAKPAAAPAATAAADADADADAAGPSEEDMLARRLLARVLPHSLAASWLEESEQDRNPVLPQGREAAVMRVALHEKTARVRARQGALELRERELAASECVSETSVL